MQFAGAHNPVYIVRNSELIELKADKNGIGAVHPSRTAYNNQQLELKNGDMIYLFTDGFPDQVGGPNRKKFYYPPFRNLLVSISKEDLQAQRNNLNEIHVQWQGENYDQTDDILIMGIRY